jgi:hypothetical protein
MIAMGVVARKVDVDVRELMAWASAKGLQADGATRSQYAATLVKDSSKHLGS